MGRNNKKVICNIKPSDKECRPLTSSVPEMLDEKGDILKEKCDELENKYVHEIYETMAEHFSHTRGIPWPKVKNFVSSFGPGSLLLDVGCGNGRFMDCVKDSKVFFMGTDRCKSLLESARTRNPNLQVFVDNCMKLNIRSGTFDGIICIAVLHHLSTPERRIQAVSELIRCLRRNGTLLIYVWAFEQKKGTVGSRSFSSKDTMVPWHFQKKYAKDNHEKAENIQQCTDQIKEEMDDPQKEAGSLGNIVRVPPEKYLIALQRYYHLFEEQEIVEICNKGIEKYKEGIKGQGDCELEEDVSIIETYFDCNNWAVKIAKN
ncbi:Ymb4 methylase [Cryptosporidium ubiquitum]|uniref:Ymb4 methylase n=1 Tax=Cryptosporidium ubiquitum TaxID=857276 RepID=A0A1J4MI98_9CRYT|nr:Ymb4 methylase [Cryptosporidium ubiquitum]OII73936.1 Ymb4 methylase [Cryptosporidium ubiquitum]